MKPTPPGGVPLLDAGEAAGLLGMSLHRFTFHEHTLGLIRAMDTPQGPRYREDELLELLAAITPPDGPPPERLKVGEAARILGVSTRTLLIAAKEGVVTRDKRGLYDAEEIRALNEARNGRKALRVPEWMSRAS